MSRSNLTLKINGLTVNSTHMCCATFKNTNKSLVWRLMDLKHTQSQFMMSQQVSLLLIKDGLVYFVRADNIGQDFGFPRLGIKKRYKW